MKEGDEFTEVRDFGLVLGTAVEGELPLLVGGHAVNLWAWFFRSRIGKALDQWLPLTSKDLDLVGTVALLDDLKSRFGGIYRLSGPRSPVVGQLVVRIGGKDLKIDILKDVFGLSPKDLAVQAPIIRAYLSELIEATEAGLIDSRIAVIQLELVRKVAASADAAKCSAMHGICFNGIWPREALDVAHDSRLRNFMKHRLPASG